MDPVAWLGKAHDELVELGRSAELDPSDAWRALALLARIDGNTYGLAPPLDIVDRLPVLLAVGGKPDVQGLLDRLSEELTADEDAWGPLLDVLIDADDTVGVLRVSGEVQASRELASRVAGLASLWPERLLSLHPFAEMRLRTVGDEAAVGCVWRAVEAAPARLLVEALPDVTTNGRAARPAHTPWIRTLYENVRGSIPSIGRAASGLIAQFRPLGLQPEFVASLGEPRRNPAEPAWGDIQEIDVPLKATVQLRVPATCQLWHATATGTVLLDVSEGGFAWQLEPGESPVVLLATESTGATSFRDSMSGGARATGVVLVEEGTSPEPEKLP